MYGVSPAWFLSLFGNDFSCEQAASSLRKLKKMGFSSWQPEIFLPNKLKEWEGSSARSLFKISEDLEMYPSQFVAHFLLSSFISEESLDSDWGISQCRDLMGILDSLGKIKIITIPLPTFQSERPLSTTIFKGNYEKTIVKLTKMANLIESSGRFCNVEILPGSLISGSEGFLRLTQKPGLENLGINLDTGHFNSMNEKLDLTLGRIASKVRGTHLCDNDGITNNSHPPGLGTVYWPALKLWSKELTEEICWDIEINCLPEKVEEYYTQGLKYIKSLDIR